MSKRNTMRGAAVPLLALAVLAVAAVANAAPPVVHGYAGHYQGFFASTSTLIAPFTIDLAPSRTQVYGGTLLSADVRAPFRVAISPRNDFVAVGSGPAGFVAIGQATVLADGSSISRARYIMRTPFGLDRGSLHFLQSFPGPGAATLPGTLAGSCTAADGSRAPISLRVNGQQGPDFQGAAVVGGVALPTLGTVGSPDLRTGVGNPDLQPVDLIGDSVAGSLDFSGSWVSGGQPHMNGTATLTLADGSVSVSDCALLPAVRPSGQ
jgi:hypothetical protein